MIAQILEIIIKEVRENIREHHRITCAVVMLVLFSLIGKGCRLINNELLAPLLLDLDWDISVKISLRGIVVLIFVWIALLLVAQFSPILLPFEESDLLFVTRCMVGYTLVIIILIRLFGDTVFLNYHFWLAYMPLEGYLTLTYILAGSYALEEVALWTFLPTIFAPYGFLTLIRRRKARN